MTRWSRSSILAVAGMWLAGFSIFAQTVSFELKNGDRITGSVLSETNNRVLLSNALSREIIIPLSEISKRTAQNPPTNTAVAVVSTNALAKTNHVALAKAVAVTNRFFSSPLLKNWHGDVQVGADLTFSERN